MELLAIAAGLCGAFIFGLVLVLFTRVKHFYPSGA